MYNAGRSTKNYKYDSEDKRISFLIAGIFVLIIIYTCQFFSKSILDHASCIAQAQDQYIVEEELPSTRGLIYASDKYSTNNYFPIALNEDTYQVSVVPKNVKDKDKLAQTLADILKIDKKEIFDRLWRWGKKYMQHQEGPMKGYFAWSLKTDGTRNSQGPASDGELYYVTALIFASNRWGNDTGINYLAEAQNILNCSQSKTGENGVVPLIHPKHKLINFVPIGRAAEFTDPSYHIPAFYEVWARWAEDGRADYWRECAVKSREYLHKSIHPVTGLNPDYNNYDGTLLNSGRIIGDAFRFDSWRVPMNIALDYSWANVDRKWQQNYANKIQKFFYSKGLTTFVDQYNVDGTDVKEVLPAGEHKALRHSLGLVATSAAVSLAAKNSMSREFVDQLWNAKHEPYDDGYFDAYYDGLLRLFAFMHLSGNYQIIFPKK